MNNKKIIPFNVILFSILFIMFKIGAIDNFIKYIMFETVDIHFKDLLSISSTFLSIFLGFIATSITVIISMSDKRMMKLVKDLGKINIIYKSMNKSIMYGLISLLGISIMYISGDFNIIYIRIIIILITLNTLFISLNHSIFLVKFMKMIIEKMFFSNEELVVTANIKNRW